MGTDAPQPLLEVRDLSVSYRDSGAIRPAVIDVDLTVREGECLAIVGESGSGKSTTALSAMDLLPPNATVEAEITFGDTRLSDLKDKQRRRLNGGEVAMVFQSPMSALNPLRTVGSQVARTLRIHQPDLSKSERNRRVMDLLEKVGIPDPRRRARQYPHQFSGGMRQRVVIAMAVANHPRLLIADEPTTALDVTVQAQIIHLLRMAAKETNASLLLISHDLGLVSELADRVAVMYAGRIVEHGPMAMILREPRHPYTRGLIATAEPRAGRGHRLPVIPGSSPAPGEVSSECSFRPRCPIGRDRDVCRDVRPPLTGVGAAHASACHFPEEPAIYDTGTAISGTREVGVRPALEMRCIEVTFPVKSRVLRRTLGEASVLRGVDLDVGVGETVAIVGETGSGKTTLARTIVGLQTANHGSVSFPDAAGRPEGRLSNARRSQMVFQDPKGSLNPRMTIGAALTEPLTAHGLVSSRQRVSELLDTVGLPADTAGRYPHQLSGGQQQRVCIARALAVEPNLLVLDEPVSALDVSVQAQILNLLVDIQGRLGVSYVLIAHDVSMVAMVAHRVAVMYLGRIVEIGDPGDVLSNPQHPYTQALVAAIPDGLARGRRLEPPVRGEPPSPFEIIAGCAFRSRCPEAFDACLVTDPVLVPTGSGSRAACLLFAGERR